MRAFPLWSKSRDLDARRRDSHDSTANIIPVPFSAPVSEVKRGDDGVAEEEEDADASSTFSSSPPSYHAA